MKLATDYQTFSASFENQIQSSQELVSYLNEIKSFNTNLALDDQQLILTSAAEVIEALTHTVQSLNDTNHELIKILDKALSILGDSKVA